MWGTFNSTISAFDWFQYSFILQGFTCVDNCKLADDEHSAREVAFSWLFSILERSSFRHVCRVEKDYCRAESFCTAFLMLA